jgi:aminoglycoside phosphotransferase (APT) family kinase protein
VVTEIGQPTGGIEPDVIAETKLTVHQRDLGELAGSIAGWLGGALDADGPVRASDVHAPEGGGMSSVTVLFTADWTTAGRDRQRRLVARLAPDDTSFPVFPHYDLAQQFRLIADVGVRSEVPVPAVVGVETSGDVLGVPFGVMAAVAGRIPSDNPPYVFGGWLCEATAGQRRDLQDGTVAVLAGLHQIADPAVAFDYLRPDGDPLRAHFAGQRAHYDWTHQHDGVRIPVLERAFDWLEARWPGDPGEAVLSWGDARPGNVVYDGFAPAAVLDWEMATLAPREVDLAWMVFLHRFFQDIAELFELPGLADFCRREDVVARYQQISGYAVRDFDWYLVYAALRHGIVMSQVHRRMIHFGEVEAPADPDGYVMHHDALDRLMDGSYRWD